MHNKKKYSLSIFLDKLRYLLGLPLLWY